MKFKPIHLIAATLLLLGSCGTPQDVAYMQNADQIPQSVLAGAVKTTDAVVMPGDMLQITVSALNAEAVKPFNRGGYLSAESGATLGNSSTGDQASNLYYLVDNNGDIDYPMLGRINVGGKTQSEIQELIASKIFPKYLTEKPAVEVRFKNFKVSVLGEVKSPGIITAQNARMNILEALAQAGDLNIQGRRDNVMLIRTKADGSREVHTINLTDKNLLVSPYFDLQQNDIIYVTPNDSRARSSWQVPPGVTLGLSGVGTLISIATFIVTLTK